MPRAPAANPRSIDFSACLDIVAIRARIAQLMARAVPELTMPAHAAVVRLASNRWALEWQLSRLLGEAYGLLPKSIESLTVCAVLGLCAIRAMDDLADERPEANQTSRVMLSNLFYTQALLQYFRLFDTQAVDTRGAFSESVSLFMSQWTRSALLPPDRPMLTFTHNTLPGALDSDEAARLAWRGAPLKICAVAACLLADCGHRLPSLTRALDRAVLAMVLLDHFMDWEEDLVMGRGNVYVAHVSPGPQNKIHVDEHRLRVMQKMLDIHGNDVYFGAIAMCLADALTYAKQSECPLLCRHLRALTNQVKQYGLAQGKTARALLHEAAALMFDDAHDATGPGA